MTNSVRSCYQTCRILSGLTQEDAAAALGCSVRTLSRYESGEAWVPEDMVGRMTALYGRADLCLWHMQAAGSLPGVEVRELPAAAIRIINRVRRFAERHRERELLEISEDGIISPEERPLFDEILEELREIARSTMELQVCETAPQGRQTGRGNVQAARAAALR